MNCHYQRLLASFLILSMVSACDKQQEGGSNELVGTWVNSTLRADSLEIYREGNSLVLFDNSMAYRSHANPEQVKDNHKWYIRLKDGELQVEFYDRIGPAVEWGAYGFKWIRKGERFEVESLAFRPYISCLGCKLEYERVK